MLPVLKPEQLDLECPTCGATGQTAPQCRRCRSDLRLLHQLQQQRGRAFHEAAAALAEARWSDALVSAQYAHILRQDEASFRLLAVCQLLNRQWDAACDTRRQAAALGQR